MNFSMKKRLVLIAHKGSWLLILLVLVSACSKGFERNQVYQQMKTTAPDVMDVNPNLQTADSPALPFPVKLAVYLDSRSKVGQWRWDWNWQRDDALPLLKLQPVLQNYDIVSEIFFLPESLVNGWDLADIKQAAARYGANALLVLNGAPYLDQYLNPWASLYPTFVGLWLAPGTTIDTLFVIEGSLWSTHNNHRYLAVEAEGIVQMKRPLVFALSRHAISLAKAKGIQQFSATFEKEILKLSGVEEEEGVVLNDVAVSESSNPQQSSVE